MDKAMAYLSKLKTEQEAALKALGEKTIEVMLIKARVLGFKEAMETLGSNIASNESEIKSADNGEQGQMILNELLYTGRAMTKQQIARAIHYPSGQIDETLKRLEREHKIIENSDGHWEVVRS
jgi:hypothetical protein